MIITIKQADLPEPYRKHVSDINFKNRVVCHRRVQGFPKRNYEQFSLHLSKINTMLGKLCDFSFEGKLTLELENGICSESGCVWVYFPEGSKFLGVHPVLETRFNEINQQLHRLVEHYPFQYKVTFRFHQWMEIAAGQEERIYEAHPVPSKEATPLEDQILY